MSPSSQQLLSVPSSRPGSWAFAVIGPRLWKTLPSDKRTCSTIENFKSTLKTYQFLLFLFSFDICCFKMRYIKEKNILYEVSILLTMCYGKLCCASVVCCQTFWMLLEEVIVDQIQAKKALKSSLAVPFQVQVQRRVASIVIFVSRVSTLRCRCCFCKVNCWSVVVMANRQSSAGSCMAAVGRLLSVAACRARRGDLGQVKSYWASLSSKQSSG